MMGTKARIFGPIPNVSLEDLVPPDHFYRHVERTLDLTFVRDLVKRGRRPPSTTGMIFFTVMEAGSHRQGLFQQAARLTDAPKTRCSSRPRSS